jgi:glycosyltransferase involved in cell wall biosynthesis
MKKVLYIGHFRESSGWSEAAKHLALSMDYAGIDLVVRSVKLDGHDSIHPRLQELENRSTKGCNVVIQHVLPQFYEYSGVFDKNIGYFVGEGSSFFKVGWNYKCNLMDEIWVPNRQLKQSLKTNNPIHVVHHTHDISAYSKPYTSLLPEEDGYKFYCIVDFANRKNLRGFIEAFHSEFSFRENVNLVIKISKNGASDEQLHQAYSELNDDVCTHLGKHKNPSLYQETNLITRHMSEDGIHALHSSCDCYVTLSHGEAWNYPCADAIFHGNEVIASNIGGHKEYVPLSSGILIGGVSSVAQGYDSLPNYQTCEDRWFIPNTLDAMRAMRQKFNESQATPGFQKIRDSKRRANRELVHKFSYHTIGNQIKELI